MSDAEFITETFRTAWIMAILIILLPTLPGLAWLVMEGVHAIKHYMQSRKDETHDN